MSLNLAAFLGHAKALALTPTERSGMRATLLSALQNTGMTLVNDEKADLRSSLRAFAAAHPPIRKESASTESSLPLCFGINLFGRLQPFTV